MITEEENESYEIVQVVHGVEDGNTGKTFETWMKICGKMHKMQIDIGASNSIINESTSRIL